VRPKSFVPKALKEKKAFESNYPMLAHVYSGISELLGNDSKSHYVEYVKDMDRLRRLKNRS
jgi:hypothetical protein